MPKHNKNDPDHLGTKATSEKRPYADMVEGLPDAVVLFNNKGILYCNEAACRLVGADSLDQILGRPVTDFIAPESRELLLQRLQSLSIGDQILPPHVQLFKRLDGTIVEVEVSSIPIHLNNEQAALSVVRDISKRHATERQILQAEKMAALREIMSGVAHEINNPNTFISFNIPILRNFCKAIQPLLDDHAKSNPGFKVHNLPYTAFLDRLESIFTIMENGCDRITGVVEALRDYVSGQDVSYKEPTSVQRLYEKVMALASKQLERTIREVTISVPDDLPPVVVNADRLVQVIIHLVLNAAHAADKPDSHLELSARYEPEHANMVTLSIVDNGCGIPSENLSKVFELFYTTQKAGSGSGLGLAISKSIVEEHGGQMRIISEVNKGTEVQLTLPIEQEDWG